ncbi:hypothetical protein EV645_4453 [Kribbella rubisoli]|uniref:Uncharacterized protein n=1 Tax=Kribbella rubisoli TaxID=3075929 RepID=A0A4Q7WUY9_9ACTN|nr:hypothetical protein EV645_4453 [Kribbella rubisoli]
MSRPTTSSTISSAAIAIPARLLPKRLRAIANGPMGFTVAPIVSSARRCRGHLPASRGRTGRRAHRDRQAPVRPQAVLRNRRRSRWRSRARCRRDFTVSTGTASTSAHSSRLRSSRWNNTSTSRSNRGTPPTSRRYVDPIDHVVRRIGFVVLRELRLVGVLVPQLVDHAATGDREEPRGEPVRLFEARQPADDAQPDLLRHVVGHVIAAQHLPHRPPDRPVPPPHQLSDRLPVPQLSPRHHRHPTPLHPSPPSPPQSPNPPPRFTPRFRIPPPPSVSSPLGGFA